MQIYKCCTNDFDFNETVCLNLVDQFPEENKLVQAEVSFWVTDTNLRPET